MRLPIKLSDLFDRSIAPAPLCASTGRTTFAEGYLVLGSLAFVNFIANFLLFSEFGFYEDDYIWTLAYLGMSPSNFALELREIFLEWPQGRPVFWVIQVTLSWLVGFGKTIWPFYLFSFVMTSGVAFALFAFLRRFVSLPAAFLSAVFFLLFPPDTSTQIFMHQVAIGFSTLMTLAAYSLYFKGRATWAYLVGAVMLLTYEPYFLLLFFLPALGRYENKREMVVVFIRNGVTLAIVLFVVLLVRALLGESRASDVMSGELPTYLLRAMLAPWIGGWTALHSCFARPMESLLHASAAQRLLSAAGAAAMFSSGWILWRARMPAAETRKESTPAGGLTRSLRVQFIGFGMAMWLFAYVYRFYPDYYPPHVNMGRLSALHAVGLFGLCLSIAALLDGVFAARTRLGIPILTAAAIYCGLLVGFGIEVQETQYVKNWKQQKAFLQGVLDQIGDLEENDVVLVDIDLPPGTTTDLRPETEGFPAFWMANYPVHIFAMLFETPEEWETEPELYGLWDGAAMERVAGGLEIATPSYEKPENFPVISSGQFLLFEWTVDGLVRSDRPVVFEGEEFLPKPPSESMSRRHPTAPLYRTLFETEDRSLWPTFSPSRNYPLQTP